MITTLNNIFKNGSKTYFYSSLFFPSQIRSDVTILYAFVRVADNYVDELPQDRKSFDIFWEEFWNCFENNLESENVVINEFNKLAKRKNFDKYWIKAFEDSMRSDLTENTYKTIEDTLKYIYGSAEVIGLMMANILNVPEEGRKCAMMLGRAMQYANFIRDIDEDLILGRCYFPKDSLNSFNLNSLDKVEVVKNRENFVEFIKAQCQLYYSWQLEAEEGYKYLSNESIRAVKTASIMYKWTIKQIEIDPFIVYKGKVRPSILRIMWTAIMH